MKNTKLLGITLGWIVLLCWGTPAALWAQEEEEEEPATVSLDLGASSSVFADVGGGVRTSSFEVVENLQSLVFLVYITEGNPVVEFVDPSGAVWALDHPSLEVERTEWGLSVGLPQPALGTWLLRLSQTLGEGSYDVETLSVPAVPTLTLTEPIFEKEPWSALRSFSGTTQASQVGKTVTLVIHDVENPQWSLPVHEVTVAADGSFSAPLDPAEIPAGEYTLTAMLDQDDAPSIQAQAPGTLRRPEPPLLTAVQSFVALAEDTETLIVSFAHDYGRRQASFRLSIRPATGPVRSFDLGVQTQARIPHFDPGTYEIWVTPIDDLNRAGASSPVATVTFGAPAPQVPALVLQQPELAVTLVNGVATVTFALVGTFPGTDPAQSYLQVEFPDLPAATEGGIPVSTLPKGLFLSPSKSRWHLPTEAQTLSIQVRSDDSVDPGLYRIGALFYYFGQDKKDHFVAATVVVTVPAPVPAITSIEPSQWLLGEDPVVQIDGTHFADGSRVLIDGQEVPLTFFNSEVIRFEAPATLAGGNHQLTIAGGSVIPSQAVTVLAPRYTIIAYKIVGQVQAQDTARFWLGIQGDQGFDGSTSFQVGALPAGWQASVEPPVVASGAQAVIAIQVPTGAPAGETLVPVTTPEGREVTLKVRVTAQAPAPSISSLSQFSALPGGEFLIRGYGFGDQGGSVVVEQTPWTVLAWADDEIRVQVPALGETGLLRVQTSTGTLSNGVTFGVKNYSFQFHTNQLEFAVQGGDTKTIEIQLAGYPEDVLLSAETGTSLLSATWSKPIVKPLGLTQLIITVDPNIPVGRYPVTVTGTSSGAGGVFTTSLELELRVGAALQWATQALPAASVQTVYAAQLAATDGEGALRFSLTDGQLPPGLSLKGSQIQGRPTDAGSYRVILSVADSAGHETANEFILTVRPSGWERPGRDEGGSAFSAVDAPADQRTLWVSAPIVSSDAGAAPTSLLASDSLLYASANGFVQALYLGKGSPMFRISGTYTSWQLSQGQIFALASDDQKTLSVWSDTFGVLAWSRPAVDRFWVKAGVILAQSGAEVLVIDAANGTLVRSVPADLSGLLVGWQGDLYRLRDAHLERWSDTDGWSVVYSDPNGRSLTRVQADSAALLVQNQDLLVRSWTGTAAVDLWTGPIAHLVLGETWLAVDTGTTLDLRDRTSGALLRTLGAGGSDSLLASREKLFAIQGGMLNALNLTTGAVIWQTSAIAAVLSGDRLYTLASDGRVSAHHAPDNLAAPTTTLVTSPAGPNGNQGWFITAPQVSLNAIDPETYAASTQWKVGEGDWEAFAPRTLTDGQYSLVWHSTDTKGLQEADRFASLSVDATPPVTQAVLSPAALPNLPGVYDGPVTVTLSATDALSGLAAIEYRIDAATWTPYTAPFTVTAEGAHQVEFHSRDQAGGWEPVQTLSFTIDSHLPTATAEVIPIGNVTIVFLTGVDNGSGIARLEYKINEGAVQTYGSFIFFGSAGTYVLAYRAVDNSGRAGAWATVTIVNQGAASAAALANTTGAAAARTTAELDTQVSASDPIFANSTESFLTLPAELAGASYLRRPDTDGRSTAAGYVSLTFRSPVVVHYLKESDSKVALTGWTRGAFVPAGTLSRRYFPGGLQTWTKSFAAGDKLELPGPGLNRAGGDLVFIQPSWLGLAIVSPAPGTGLKPGQQVTLQAFTGAAAGPVTWTLGEGRGARVLGTGNPLTVTLPADLGDRNVTLQATLPQGRQSLSDKATFDVLHVETLKILAPTAQRAVKLGASLQPVVLWRDARGRPAAAPSITWTLKKGDQVVYQGPAPVPVSVAGPLTLTGTAAGASGSLITATTTVITQSDWPWVRWRWSDKQPQGWNDDQGEGFGGEARADREPRRTAPGPNQRSLEVWRWSQNAEYRVAAMNGTYEVSMTVGPLNQWEVHTVTVNQRAANLMAKKPGEVIQLRFVVTVTDGILSIKGTPGLPAYRLDYRRTDQTAPARPEVKTLNSPEELE